MNKEEMKDKIIEILNDNAVVNKTETSTAILEDQYPFIADEILGCFSEVVSPAEPTNSEWLMLGARQRFKELKDYEYGWKSFYAGWVEGRAHAIKAKAGSGGTPV